jgi:hypothetical protein
MDERDLRILGRLPQLCFLVMKVTSVGEVVFNDTRSHDDACLFQKLRRCTMKYSKGVRFLLPNQDSGSVSFLMREVEASMVLGSSERLDTVCKGAGVAPTPMPRFQKLSFTLYVKEFIKDHNQDDGCVSLALQCFASLQNVQALIHCGDGTSAAEVGQVEAALRRAADGHPNRPTLEVIRTG